MLQQEETDRDVEIQQLMDSAKEDMAAGKTRVTQLKKEQVLATDWLFCLLLPVL